MRVRALGLAGPGARAPARGDWSSGCVPEGLLPQSWPAHRVFEELMACTQALSLLRCHAGKTRWG